MTLLRLAISFLTPANMLRTSTRTLPTTLAPNRARLPRARSLHDRGIWGYQAPRDFTVPDFTRAELQNRVENAALLRLVESYRRHGHRAALLDPLDLAQRPVVPALDPRRYGLAATPARDEFTSDVVPEDLVGADQKYQVQGILDFPEDGNGPARSVDEIAARLAEVYCGGVAYEVSRPCRPVS